MKTIYSIFLIKWRDGSKQEMDVMYFHYNYLYTNAYEQSQKAWSKQAANKGEYLPKGKFHDESHW